MAGHANGLITINVEEADHFKRERSEVHCWGTSGTRWATLLGPRARHQVAGAVPAGPIERNVAGGVSKVLTKDEARRIAVKVARLPQLLGQAD